jgi:hypothetical protein
MKPQSVGTDQADSNNLSDAAQQLVHRMSSQRPQRDGDLGQTVRVHETELRQLELHLAQEVEDPPETVVRPVAKETDLMFCSLHGPRLICSRTRFLSYFVEVPNVRRSMLEEDQGRHAGPSRNVQNMSVIDCRKPDEFGKPPLILQLADHSSMGDLPAIHDHKAVRELLRQINPLLNQQD